MSHTDAIEIVVVGAHLSGMALNHQLSELGGSFVRSARRIATLSAGIYHYMDCQRRDPKQGSRRARSHSTPRAG